MADAVYEVTSVLDGKLADFPGHVERLARSLSELKMESPLSDEELAGDPPRAGRAQRPRGGADLPPDHPRRPGDRDFVWPKDTAPTVVLFTQEKPLEETQQSRTGIRVVTIPDLRWGRRDIKTVQLLYPSFGKMEAKARGADDAWMVEDGFVTEGTSNNAYIVTRDGTIVTRHLGTEILHGITRAAALDLARESQMQIEERPFTVEEAQNAAEAFITAASTFVCPVVEIDGVTLGDGTPGPVTRRLREIYVRRAKEDSI